MTPAIIPFPEFYKWILDEKDPPKLIAESIKLVGIREYPGKAVNNPIIMNMAKDLDIPAAIYPNDETAWCALDLNWLCFKTGKPLSYTTAKKDKYDLLRANSFMTWGIESVIPMFGDIVIFSREDGFHVGILIGEDLTHYHVLGGNQGNGHGFVRIEKGRLVACRRFYKILAPHSVRQITLSPLGPISRNEV